jgi:VanZ family protein
MTATLKYQKLTLLWALFVLILCCAPIGNVEHTPGQFFFPGFDKLVHCGLFFVFTVALANGLLRRYHILSVTQALVVFVTGVAFGGLIELLQRYVFTYREGDWSDLFADAVGAGMAAFCILVTLSATRYEKA